MELCNYMWPHDKETYHGGNICSGGHGSIHQTEARCSKWMTRWENLQQNTQNGWRSGKICNKYSKCMTRLKFSSKTSNKMLKMDDGENILLWKLKAKLSWSKIKLKRGIFMIFRRWSWVQNFYWNIMISLRFHCLFNLQYIFQMMTISRGGCTMTLVKSTNFGVPPIVIGSHLDQVFDLQG